MNWTPNRRKFLKVTSYYGQVAELDRQNRILLPQQTRTKANTVGKVDVLGHGRYLHVWDHERLDADIEADPITDDELAALAEEEI